MLSNTFGKCINKYTTDYVVFDLETTGISPNHDEIIEISAVKVRGGKIVDEFSTLVNPKRSIPDAASRVNNITDSMVAGAPVISEVLPKFIEFIGDDVLAGHNIQSFDLKFIYRDCSKLFGKIPNNNYIDTLKIARTCLPKLAHHNLGVLAKCYNISTEGAHRALNDCRMNQQVLERLFKNPAINKADNKPEKACPACGRAMNKRNGRFGLFWGCSGYPACRYTENI